MKDILPEGRDMEDGSFPDVHAMLGALMLRDAAGLTMDREPQNRLVVACYHHALLLASMLRSQGIPVRLRAGFARYFEKEANVRFGHVICEVWDDDKRRWLMVDPDRNYIDLSDRQFEFPSHAWNNLRKGKLPDVTYTSSAGKGLRAIIHDLLLDQTFVLGEERNYWHTPGFLFADNFSMENLEPDQIQVIDQIALLMRDPESHLDELQDLYDHNNFLHAEHRSIETYYRRYKEGRNR
jgi:hypothetical protein